VQTGTPVGTVSIAENALEPVAATTFSMKVDYLPTMAQKPRATRAKGIGSDAP
jgi:hypothetical protein